MKYLKDNWAMILIFVILAILLYRSFTNDSSIQTQIIIHKDTSFISFDSTIYSHPTIIKEIKDSTTIKYIPDSDYGILLNQFEELKNDFLTLRIYEDSTKFDSSTVKIIDTVKENKLIGRSYTWDLKIPTITINSYIPPKLTPQIYLGGQIEAGPNTNPQISINGLLKTKTDKIYGIGMGINTKGEFIYNISSYWKLK